MVGWAGKAAIAGLMLVLAGPALAQTDPDAPEHPPAAGPEATPPAEPVYCTRNCCVIEDSLVCDTLPGRPRGIGVIFSGANPDLDPYSAEAQQQLLDATRELYIERAPQ